MKSTTKVECGLLIQIEANAIDLIRCYGWLFKNSPSDLFSSCHPLDIGENYSYLLNTAFVRVYKRIKVSVRDYGLPGREM